MSLTDTFSDTRQPDYDTVSERRADPLGVAAADVDALAQWIDERASIARQTASLAIDAAAPRWN